MSKPTDDDSLREAVRGRGYRPARAELPALLSRLAVAERDEAELIERALARLGAEAARAALARFPPSRPPERARLARLVGRVAQEQASPEPALRAFLLERLGDEDAKTRRNAVIALGKLGGPDVSAALEARWPEADPYERRSIAAALGKVGGEHALALLAAVGTSDPELDRIAREARLKLERTLGRAERRAEGAIDPQAAPPRPLRVRLHCRFGLAPTVAAELPALRPRVVDEETVEATLAGPLEELFASRAALRFGFPLPGATVVDALASDEAWGILTAFTRGPIRYRLEWAGAGHRRGLTFRTAEAVAARRPELHNDPTESLWEAVITERESGPPEVELWPRGLPDPRFAWRRAHVPASSHPTLAAALARLGEARADDVVWDPFVGAGSELVERARLGPYRRLVGTDLSPGALELARANLGSAGVARVELAPGDARIYVPPEPPTLILTNPPMGRRVLDKHQTGALYDAFLDHAARVLAPGGRLVWISPRAPHTAARAKRLGLVERARQRVDMGGFWAELQRFDLPARPSRRR